MSNPEWLAEALHLPVAFAQVREDPAIDVAIANHLDPGSSLLMIASGGCTAACLARHPRLRDVTLVDANPAQLALTRLKFRLLERCSPQGRLALLGHQPLAADARKEGLSALLEELGLAEDSLGDLELVARLGPDYSGRYERLFAALQEEIIHSPGLAQRIEDLLHSGNLVGQRDWLAGEQTAWEQLCARFTSTFAQSNLVALFGECATQNRVLSFADHFIGRLHHVLSTQVVASNPYVWQLLRGQYPPQNQAPWLALPAGPIPVRQHVVQATVGHAMQEALQCGRHYHMLHLSNVLDWLTEAEAQVTLQAAWDCAADGAWLVIRQLNSSLDLAALGERIGWRWEPDMARQLFAADRSFFYRRLLIGRRP